MKKEVTVGQLLTIAFTLLVTIVSAWVTINNKVSKLETQAIERDKQMDRYEAKIEKINETTTRILIELQNKQNR